ncbi:MAG TPA: sarcosine oxidase subunit alpha [Thermoplasmatales archaeon]|nr:sarcosine oxidase subunit alpha [Thermoplasmatales archaeon]
MRIKEHPILNFDRRKEIYFYYNGKKIKAYEGETIASALHAEKVKVLSRSIKLKRPRGFFCGIGKCSSCLMKVNGIPNVRTCITLVREGMVVEDNDMELSEKDYPECKFEKIECEIAIVGGGPAGLSAGIEASEFADVLVIDENHCLGGQLIKQTHKFFGSKEEKAGIRGIEIAKELEKEAVKNCRVLLNTSIIGYYDRGYHFLVGVNKIERVVYEIKANKIIFTTGAQENMLVFEGNDLPGVYGAGGVQTLMNVYGIKPGNKGLIVGAGNVGLILAYQLLQAGVDVACIVEAMPRIGGYFVHSAKIRRCGIPIYTSHSIKKAYGNGKVEGAVIVELDENWSIIDGSEKKISCDFICLAVGLTPSTRLVTQTGAEISFINEAGGWVALHNEYMETTKKGIYVAGDSANIEEASTAMIEGKIAGLHAVNSLKGVSDFKIKIEKYLKKINAFRQGFFGSRPKKAKEKIIEEYYEKMGKGRNS